MIITKYKKSFFYLQPVIFAFYLELKSNMLKNIPWAVMLGIHLQQFRINKEPVVCIFHRGHIKLCDVELDS